MIFQYCLIWTIGGSVDENGRAIFDNYFKKLLKDPIKCQNKKDKLVKFERNAAIPDAGR